MKRNLIIFLLFVFSILWAQNEKTIETMLSEANEKRFENTEDALQIAEKAYSLAKEKNYSNIGEISLLLSKIHLQLNHLKTAQEFAKQSIDEIPTSSSDSTYVRRFSNLAIIYNRMSEYEEAISNYQIALNYAKDLPLQKGMISVSLGDVHQSMGNFADAQKLYQSALDIYLEHGSQIELASVYNSLGNNHWYMGNYDDALSYMLKALEIHEKNGEKNGIASTLNSIGNVYYRLGFLNKTLEYFEKALAIVKETGQEDHEASTLINIGIIHLQMEDFEDAKEKFLKALVIKEKRNDKNGIIASLSNLGIAYEGLEKPNKALEYYRKSLTIREEINDQYGIIIALNNIANILSKQNKISTALQHLLRAEKIAREIQAAPLLSETYQTLAKLNAENGDFKQAYQYFKKQVAIEDSIFTKDSQEKINRLQTEYETKEKENKITALEKQKEIDQLQINKQKIIRNFFIFLVIIFILLAVLFYRNYRLKLQVNSLLAEKNNELKRKNTQLEFSEKQLKNINAMKDKFFSIIAHDLKNPIQSFLGISEVLSLRYKKMSDDKIQSYIKDLNLAANQLLSLLENLLHWSRSQTGRLMFNPEKISMFEIVKDVLLLLQPQAKKKHIFIHSEISEKDFVFADKNMIHTVVRNIVSNAIKFTQMYGEIHISGKTVQDQYELLINDNGLGMNQDDLSQLFRIDMQHSKTGTMGEKGTGLGLVLCKEFIEKNNGLLEIESKLRKGTSVHIFLPKEGKK